MKEFDTREREDATAVSTSIVTVTALGMPSSKRNVSSPVERAL